MYVYISCWQFEEMEKNMKCSYIFMAEITVPGFQSVIRVKMFVDSPVFPGQVHSNPYFHSTMVRFPSFPA